MLTARGAGRRRMFTTDLVSVAATRRGQRAAAEEDVIRYKIEGEICREPIQAFKTFHFVTNVRHTGI